MEVSVAVGTHENLIPVLGKIKDHPENKSGLIMQLIAPAYINLANPPSLETCTRDVYGASCTFTGDELWKIAKSMASVGAQLHQKGINHGDFYAHNILVNKTADCLLGDFGAASFYDVDGPLAGKIERVEVRAFGCLVEEVFSLVGENELKEEVRHKWQQLIKDCTIPEVKSRPGFSQVLAVLDGF